MNRSMKEVRRVLLVVAVLAVWTLSGALNAGAEPSTGVLAQQIQGTWTLVSCVNEQDGKKVDVFGPNPRGSLVLTPDGRYSQIIMRASLPKFASNNRMKGTAQENEAVVQGTHVYFGRYTVASEKERTVNLSVEGSTFPNWDDGVQKRVMTVSGDELRVTNPTPSIGGGTNYLIWKRSTPVVAGSQQSPPSSEQATRIEAMVNKAAALVESQGKSAFSEFSKRDSEWWFGNTYLFMYDQKLNVLFNPAFPKRVGTNPHGEKDANGKAFHDEFLRVVQAKGSGWVAYMFPKPGQTQLSQKWSYVKAVNIDGTPAIIGAGFYSE